MLVCINLLLGLFVVAGFVLGGMRVRQLVREHNTIQKIYLNRL